VIGLQAQHHTGKQAHQHDDGDGAGADVICLLNDTGKLIASGDTGHCQKQKNCGGSQAADPGDHRPVAAKGLKASGARSSLTLFSFSPGMSAVISIKAILNYFGND